MNGIIVPGGYGRGTNYAGAYGYYQVQRDEAKGIRSVNIPLIRPTFDVYATEADLDRGTWPPERFRARDRHLYLCDALFASDITPFVVSEDEDAVHLPVPLARRLVTVQADVLLMSAIETRTDLKLRDTASNALRDMLAYGGTVFLAREGDDGAEIESMDPLLWYPLLGGGAIFLRPYISVQASTPIADRAEVTIVRSSGEIVVQDRAYYNGELGQAHTEEEGGAGVVLTLARRPELGIWGHSLYVDLAPLLFELTKRFSQNSDILDKNADPTPVFSASTADALNMFPLDPTAMFDTDAEEAAAERKAIVDGYAQLRRGDAIHLNDRTQKVAFLEFDGNMSGSFSQIQLAREFVAQLSGLPAILDSLIASAPSGVSLKLQYLPFFATTSALQQDLAEALSMLLYAIDQPDEVVWPHIFDRIDAERKAERDERTASWSEGL